MLSVVILSVVAPSTTDAKGKPSTTNLGPKCKSPTRLFGDNHQIDFVSDSSSGSKYKSTTKHHHFSGSTGQGVLNKDTTVWVDGARTND
jgi:hypothetical protein